jgi:hypothetical protein
MYCVDEFIKTTVGNWTHSWIVTHLY